MVDSFLPKEFLNSISDCSFFKENDFIKAHLNGPVVSIRNNPFKSFTTFDEASMVPWCKEGRYLRNRPEFIFDPLFHAGAYYVQEASSMSLDFILRELNDLPDEKIVLDLCAAPGGKSTIISSFLNNSGLLVSNENILSRSKILKENLIKWNSYNSIVTNNDPLDFGVLKQTFDVILVDAPCSGSGLFRKDKDAIKQWSKELVGLCSSRQKRILSDVMPSLKQNGYLIYCTCSFSKEENEEILDWLMINFDFESIPVKFPAEWGIVETRSSQVSAVGYRFYPDKLNGEGFFISILKYSSNDHVSGTKYLKIKSKESQIESVKKWIAHQDGISIHKENDDFILFPQKYYQLAQSIKEHLNGINYGVIIGREVHGELIPDHQLAMSLFLSDEVTSIELNLADSIKFLRKENIAIHSDAKGWVVVKYLGLSLGWIKILNNRSNNYYPKEWRILKEYRR